MNFNQYPRAARSDFLSASPQRRPSLEKDPQEYRTFYLRRPSRNGMGSDEELSPPLSLTASVISELEKDDKTTAETAASAYAVARTLISSIWPPSRTPEPEPQPMKEPEELLERSQSTIKPPLKTSALNPSVMSRAQILTCRLCEGRHALKACPQFLSMSPQKREQTARELRFCLNCLAFSHSATRCPSTVRCRKCDRTHHTLLHTLSDHPRVPPPVSQRPGAVASKRSRAKTSKRSRARASKRPHAVASKTFRAMASQRPRAVTPVEPERANFLPQAVNPVPLALPAHRPLVLKPTAVVRLQTASGFAHHRALFDSGCDMSEISVLLVRQLGLETTRWGEDTIVRLHLQPEHGDEPPEFISFHALVTAWETTTPLQDIGPQVRYGFANVKLADPEFFCSHRVRLRLGNEVITQLYKPGALFFSHNQPFAQNTSFGWVLSGSVSL